VTKLGRLVKDGTIKSLEEIQLFSLPIKVLEIIDFFSRTFLEDACSEADQGWPVCPLQGFCRRAIGDHNGHVGLKVK